MTAFAALPRGGALQSNEGAVVPPPHGAIATTLRQFLKRLDSGKRARAPIT